MDCKNYEIVEKFQKKLLIKCKKCGRIDIVNHADLSEYRCKTCTKFNVVNINHDAEVLSKLVNDTSKDTKLKINKKYYSNNLSALQVNNINDISNKYNIEGFIFHFERNKYNTDTNYSVIDEIACKCKNCGYTKIIKIDNNSITGSTVCNNCKIGYNDKHNENTANIWNKLKGIVTDINGRAESKTHVKDSYNTKLLDKQRKELKKTRKDKSEHTIKLISPKISDKMQKALNKVKELNPDFDIEGFTVNGAEYTVKCSCNKCGNDVSIASSLKKKKVECEGCKKLRINPNYRGIYHKNNVNNCKNNMVVTKDLGKKVEVSCVLCSNKYVVNKYDWMYGNIYCDMDHDLLDATVICESCKNYVVLKTSEIIKYKGDGSDTIICNYCKNPVTHIDEDGIKRNLNYSDIISDLAGSDSRITRSRNFGLAIRELKSTTSTVNNLCRSNQILYVDTNGERYYNCRCLEHNQNMILTDNEIDNFNHSQCEDIRNIIVKEEMINNTNIR